MWTQQFLLHITDSMASTLTMVIVTLNKSFSISVLVNSYLVKHEKKSLHGDAFSSVFII